MAEVQLAKVREAKIDRHQRNGEGGEKLQHPGGEEGQTQDFHGALAKILRGVANIIDFCLTAVKNTQGFHAAQAIEEMAAQAGQRLEVTPVGIGGTHPDQRHEKRDQRGGAEEDQCGGPVNRENSDNDQQRHAGRQRHLGQVARIIIVHIIDLLKDKRCPTAGRFALDPGGARLLEAVENLTANFIADMLPGLKTNPLTQPDHPGAQHKDQYQQRQRQQQGGCRNIFHHHPVQDPRQEPGLRDDQQTACHAKQAGNHQPATGDNTLLF